MRILHIIATLDRQAGGPSNSLRGMIAAYPGIGSVGEVLTLDDPPLRFRFYRTPTAKSTSQSMPSAQYRPASATTAHLVPWLRANRDRYDGFVLHGLWQYLGWAVRRAIHPHKPYL